MKKFFSNLLIIIYAAIAIFVTVCLLSFNEHRVTVFGNYSLVIIDSDEIKGDYNKGSLVIVSSDPKPEVGQKAFFYDVLGQNQIVLAEVTKRDDYRNTESTYVFGGDAMITESDIIGSTANAKEIPHVGTILRILESKWGYLFLVVLISLLMFLYEITKAIEDIKAGREEAKEEKKEKMEKESTKVASIVENNVEEVKENKLEEKKIDEFSKDDIANIDDKSENEETVTEEKDIEENNREELDSKESSEVIEKVKEEIEETKEEVEELAKDKIEEVKEETEINTEDIEKALDEIEDDESADEKTSEENKKDDEENKE